MNGAPNNWRQKELKGPAEGGKTAGEYRFAVGLAVLDGFEGIGGMS